MSERELRRELITAAKTLEEKGLNRGTSGNVSVRLGDGFLITPSGMGSDGLTEDDVVFVHMDGTARGLWEPSSEWLFHRDILLQRAEFGAVVHAHSLAATALACLRKDIPPFHYMIALIGGDTIRCAPYATFGTEQLSENAVLAMRGRKACLLANHGMIAAGENLAEACRITVEVETLSELYLRTLYVGEPVLLDEKEFQLAQQRFAGYGRAAESGKSAGA
jgi:L-fuculose-phosphate aldolase